MIVVKLLSYIYYLCFAWLSLLLLVGVIFLAVAGKDVFIPFIRLSFFQCYSVLAMIFIVIRLVGSIVSQRNKKAAA